MVIKIPEVGKSKDPHLPKEGKYGPRDEVGKSKDPLKLRKLEWGTRHPARFVTNSRSLRLRPKRAALRMTSGV